MNRLKSKACKGFLFYLNRDELVYLSFLSWGKRRVISGELFQSELFWRVIFMQIILFKVMNFDSLHSIQYMALGAQTAQMNLK